MPLHLLSKKSWNVYNPAAVAKVRADEAAANAREQAEEQRQDEYDAACRLALLRGLPPPQPPSPPPAPPSESHKRSRDLGSSGKDNGDYRKRRRLHGEDDTDRDIRVANQEREQQHNTRDLVHSKRPKVDDVPLTDHAGHIQLFAPPSTKDIRVKRDAEDEHKRREKESAEQNALRFSDASGLRRNIKDQPWYAASRGYSGTEELENKYIHGDGLSSGKDAFGNEDAGRERRDVARLASADPMAMMRKAQTKLKEVERERDMWKRERDRDLKDLQASQERKAWRQSTGRNQHEEGDPGLEEFSLDIATQTHMKRHREECGHRRRHTRSRSGERARSDRERSQRYRSRSAERLEGSEDRSGRTERSFRHRHEQSTRMR